MKKALFILGGVAMFAFASCDNKSDCECGAKVTVEGMEVSIPSLGSVTEFDDDCDKVKMSDITDFTEDTWRNWQNTYEESDFVLDCKEK